MIDNLETKEIDTYWVRIYGSGPTDVAKQVCRKECLRDGLCVTVQSTKFIYTGGEENGFVIELINYPRFPTDEEDIWDRGVLLALRVLEATYQHSTLIMSPEQTLWATRREQ